MLTSPTDEPAVEGTMLAFARESGAAIGDWLLIGDDGSIACDGPMPWVAGRAALAVPGEAVTIHWLPLEEGLAPAQAAAAARLMLADVSLTPIAELHVAVGAAEGGMTPVALVPITRMEEWLVAAAAAGFDPDPIMPSPTLLVVPGSGFARRAHGEIADYRAIGAAFAIEPELAGPLVGEAAVAEVDQAAFEAGLPAVLAAPLINLRQGAFARRRRLRVVEGSWRRLALYAGVLAALTLLIQVFLILSYTFAADRLEADAAALRRPGAPAVRGGFGPVATLLFEAIRSTPNAELTALDYRADGSLGGALRVDNPATLAAFRARAEASGLRVEGGAAPSGGIAEFRVRR